MAANAHPDTVPGRRLPVRADGSYPMPEKPGDYVGPVTLDGGKTVIWLLKPHARDETTPPRGRSIQHVACPPHSFVEEDDGTLTISPSIGDTAGSQTDSDGWHGWLERGVWRQV